VLNHTQPHAQLGVTAILPERPHEVRHKPKCRQGAYDSCLKFFLYLMFQKQIKKINVIGIGILNTGASTPEISNVRMEEGWLRHHTLSESRTNPTRLKRKRSDNVAPSSTINSNLTIKVPIQCPPLSNGKCST